MQVRKDAARRYDREKWLESAMEILAHEGQAKLRPEMLASKLGVTRGSFSHHFKSRDQFASEIIAYWSEAFTDNVNKTVGASGLEPKQRLLYLARLIHQERLDRYDIAFRSWAAQDSKVAKEVQKVDMKRYKFVKSIFSEMGFKGNDLEDRVRIWLIYQCAQHTVYLPEPKNRERAMLRHHAFFTQPAAEAAET